MIPTYKIVRSTAWLLIVATLVMLFSGVLMVKSFLLSPSGYNIVYRIHNDVSIFIFIPLFFFHTLAGFFMLIARYEFLNTKYMKIAAVAVWVGLFVLFAMLYSAQSPILGAAGRNTAGGFPAGSNSSSVSGNSSSANAGALITLSPSEISKHSSASDCWFIISGKVYDVTPYLPYHPGGPGLITPYCGTDATNAFATKDRNQMHSPTANEMLASYYVGDVGANVSGQNISSNTGAQTPSATNQNTRTSGRIFEYDD